MPNKHQSKQRRTKRIASVSDALILKSREAALAAVQIFNNPLITFKSEIFIVNMCIAWTYLLHAYYRKKSMDYVYFSPGKRRKKYHRTKTGAKKHWELEKCLDFTDSPIDKETANNLKFLIYLRHEIEHQMATKIDNYLSAKFQACCLNYNYYIKNFFGDDKGIENHLSFSLQFSSIGENQVDTLEEAIDLPQNIKKFIEGFDGKLSEDEYNSPKYAYRVIFIPKLVNHKGQADKVIEFIKADSPLAKDVNATYTVIKETEKNKFLPKDIVKEINKKGFSKFTMQHHIDLWKSLNAKDANKNFGVEVAGHWYWYESWLKEVEQHCEENRDKYA
ncbi:DUF3644 domain-containing protein [Anabaena sp. CCY 0017]|uniref:DUF3644 domain-containing protein n=1 Tax=Anabaena sp. CCY 0017 TaxID=3103866 RepID=UPI0039C7257E